MLQDWSTAVHTPAAPTQAEDEAAFLARVTTDGDFTRHYPDDRNRSGCDVYSHGGAVYISRADDSNDERPVVLSASQMNTLAREWLRYRGHWPRTPDE